MDRVAAPEDPVEGVDAEIGSSDDAEVIEDELVEEISIDGMCGVY